MFKVLDLFAGYTIREDGVVTSRFGRPVRQQISSVGYIRVELWQNGRGRKFLLHRLLAEAFIPNPHGKPQVNHINGDKQDNSLSNLEWVTRSENQLHAYRTGLQIGHCVPMTLSDAHKKALCGSRWKREAHVYDLDGATFHDLWNAAAHFGVSRQTILNRCKSERWPSWSKTIERR